MEKTENSDWYYKKIFDDVNSRTSVLLQLRYQFAFVIISVIAVIWTILGTVYSQMNSNGISLDDLVTFLFIGIVFTTIVVTIWRVVTHVIVREANAIGITALFCLNELDTLKEHYFLLENSLWDELKYTNLEKVFRLDKDIKYLLCRKPSRREIVRTCGGYRQSFC